MAGNDPWAVIRVVAFDWDGVLADTLSIKEAALRFLFCAHGPVVEKAALAVWNRQKGVFRRQRIQVTFQEVLGVELDAAEMDEQVRIYAKQVFEKAVAAPWIPGARAFFAQKRGLLPAYVVSAAPLAEVKAVVRRREVTRFFRGVFGGPEHKSAILGRIVTREGLLPRQLLFIGDSLSDWHAAERVGILFLGVVAPGLTNPFPPDVAILPDLRGLAQILVTG